MLYGKVIFDGTGKSTLKGTVYCKTQEIILLPKDLGRNLLSVHTKLVFIHVSYLNLGVNYDKLKYRKRFMGLNPSKFHLTFLQFS